MEAQNTPAVIERVMTRITNRPPHDLVRVHLEFDEKDEHGEFVEHVHIVHVDHLVTLCRGLLELHFEPGINPHEGYHVAGAHGISLSVLNEKGPYWWSTPGLLRNDDPAGAPILEWTRPERVWVRPGGVFDT